MSSEPPFDAVGIAQRQFPTARKGYDPSDVRAFLHEIADLVGAAQRSEAHERERAERAEERAELAEKLDRHRLVELLGEETARVLDAAREAAADIRSKAEESVARMLVEAQENARAIEDKAESAAAARQIEILAEADSLRSEANDELDRRRAEGQELIEQMRSTAEQVRIDAEAEADTLRELAREEGRALVSEAQLARERMLGDLARRRRTAREQLERLNAARERLLTAYDVVRRTVDEATTELTVVLPEAKAAGDMAMRRVQLEPTPSAQQLEAELAVARMTGLVAEAPVQTIDDLVPADDAASEADAPAEPTLTLLTEAPSRTRAAGFLGEMSMRPPAVERQGDARTRAVGECWGLWPPRRNGIPNVHRASDADGEAGADVDAAADVELVADAEVGSDVGAGAEVELGADAVEAGADVEAVTDVEAGPDDKPRTSRVDALFARIRAGRSSDSAPSNRATLSASDEPTAAGPPADGMVSVSGPDGDEPVAPAAVAPVVAKTEGHVAAGVAEGEAGASRLLARDVVLADPELELSRRLKRVLADDQNEMFDLVRRAAPESATDVLPSAADHADRYARAGLDELDTAARAGAESVGGVLQTSCRGLATEMGEALVEPMRERIVASFDECGGALDDLTDRLRALYREWKGQRISEVVRHYTAAAFAWGAYEASPRGTDLIWLVDRTGEPCPDADDNALAGAVRKGRRFPTGDRCAPAHPGCRCLVVPAD